MAPMPLMRIEASIHPAHPERAEPPAFLHPSDSLPRAAHRGGRTRHDIAGWSFSFCFVWSTIRRANRRVKTTPDRLRRTDRRVETTADRLRRAESVSDPAQAPRTPPGHAPKG